MTESAADIRQRGDDMIDTLRCQRDVAETRAETYYYAYTKALHRVEAAEAKLAAAETKLIAIHNTLVSVDLYRLQGVKAIERIRAIVGGSGT